MSWNILTHLAILEVMILSALSVEIAFAIFYRVEEVTHNLNKLLISVPFIGFWLII